MGDRTNQPKSDEERTFLQRRVARFGLFAGVAFGGFLLYRAIGLLLYGEIRWLVTPSFVFHFLACITFFIVWALTARGQRSATFVRTVEAVGLLVAAGFMMAMAHYIPLWAGPNHIILLAMGNAVIVRAIYVPSSGSRTFLIGLGIGVELVATVYLLWLDVDPQRWSTFDPSLATLRPRDIATSLALNTAAWWAMTLAAATLASRVIYGLRREARHARQLGQYRIESKLGEGGMGVVYRARHALLRRPTAIKLLKPDKVSEASLARFEREVQLMAKLRHPNTVTVFDYGRTPDGTFYYAMELLVGATLYEVVDKTGPQEPKRVLHILEQVAAALVEAHGMGLIHRDIKPSNVMVHLPHRHGGIAEVAKVLDFGLVKSLDAAAPNLTHANVVAGTPQYMSPESIQLPESVDARSDIYALGCVGYKLLTGQDVFEGTSTIEICARHLRDQPKMPNAVVERSVPPDLEAIIMRCIQKRPDDRYQDARALQLALADCADFSTFSPHDAEEWWDEYGLLFTEHSETASKDLLTVDLQRPSSSTNQ